jgi:hypothetical protein
MADHMDLEGRFPLEQFGDFLEGGVGFGLDVGFTSVEKDACDDNVTNAGEASGEGSSIGDDILSQRRFSHNVQFIVVAVRHIHFNPGLPHMDGELAVTVVLQEGVSSRFESCDEIAVYLRGANACWFVVPEVVILALDGFVLMFGAEIREGEGVVRLVLAFVDYGARKTGNKWRVLASLCVLRLRHAEVKRERQGKA